MTEAVLPSKIEIFTLWPFKEFYQALVYASVPQFIYLTIEKHLGNFHFGDSANSAAMSVLLHFLVNIRMPFCCMYYT